mgnify:CR=1 FL=1
MRSFGLRVSGILEGVVVTGVVMVLGDVTGVRLNRDRNTSRANQRSPYLRPIPTLSVVETCWRARGLIGAIARLKAAE